MVPPAATSINFISSSAVILAKLPILLYLRICWCCKICATVPLRKWTWCVRERVENVDSERADKKVRGAVLQILNVTTHVKYFARRFRLTTFVWVSWLENTELKPDAYCHPSRSVGTPSIFLSILLLGGN